MGTKMAAAPQTSSAWQAARETRMLPRHAPSAAARSRGRHERAALLSQRAASSSEASTSEPSAAAAASSGGPGVDSFFRPGQEGASRQQLFNTIAPVYDELNDRLSFGLHRVWKRMAVRWSGAARGGSALDVCCGSGDLAFRLADAVGPSGSVCGLDFSANMLADAAARQAERRRGGRGRGAAAVEWVQGDALELPWPDASFDAATMGYGLRNVSDIPRALQELRRVLRPGGRVAILDFNNATNPLADGAQAALLAGLVVPAARAAGVEDEYAYLRPSIKKFPTGREQERLALAAGFSAAVHHEIGLGLMGTLVATK